MALPPISEQYLKKKQEYENAILFFQIGDFYEIFYDDAKTVSSALDLVLTQKKFGGGVVAPMCGIPAKAVNLYSSKLVQLGHKVAVCSQVFDNGGAVMGREVEVVHTKATTKNEELLTNFANYLCSVHFNKTSEIGFIDVSTGEFFLYENLKYVQVLSLVLKYNPSEIIANFAGEQFKNFLKNNKLPQPEIVNGENAKELIDSYLNFTKTNAKTSTAEKISNSKFVLLEADTIKNLEIFKSISENKTEGTLFEVLNKCKTAMGERRLMQFLSEPLTNAEEIKARQNHVKEFFENMQQTEKVRSLLAKMPDIERLANKISTNFFSFSNAQKLKQGLLIADELRKILPHYNIENFESLNSFLEKAIDENGGILAGFDVMLDETRNIIANGEKLLQNFLLAQKELTQIKNLKLGFNKNFGYYLEAPQNQNSKIPFEYKLIQTTMSGSRFTCNKLDNLAHQIASATQTKEILEKQAFEKIKNFIAKYEQVIVNSAKSIKLIDVYTTFAFVARENDYVCPKISNEDIINIKNGRHPIVEKFTNSFCSNNTFLNSNAKIMLITGPNMGGKSTYMRQVALIVIMAQMGCFVPADSAEIGIVNQIFTRIGSSDSIVSGSSTFMVEMKELANILNNATSKSLVILDEVGRGTSTQDGFAIAQASTQYLCKTGAKVLFATHFHKLTLLASKNSQIKNFKAATDRTGDNIVFLHKITQGIQKHSFGIEVAKMAGLPQEVVDNAKKVYDIFN